MAAAPETAEVELPADFEKRCTMMCARLQAGEPMTVEYLADQIGVPYDFLINGLAVLFRSVAQSVPALVDLTPDRSLH